MKEKSAFASRLSKLFTPPKSARCGLKIQNELNKVVSPRREAPKSPLKLERVVNDVSPPKGAKRRKDLANEKERFRIVREFLACDNNVLPCGMNGNCRQKKPPAFACTKLAESPGSRAVLVPRSTSNPPEWQTFVPVRRSCAPFFSTIDTLPAAAADRPRNVEVGIVRQRTSLFERKIQENKIAKENLTSGLKKSRRKAVVFQPAAADHESSSVESAANSSSSSQPKRKSFLDLLTARSHCVSSEDEDATAAPSGSSPTTSEEQQPVAVDGRATNVDNCKANEYFDDEYVDQPDLTLNSLHDSASTRSATPGILSPGFGSRNDATNLQSLQDELRAVGEECVSLRSTPPPNQHQLLISPSSKRNGLNLSEALSKQTIQDDETVTLIMSPTTRESIVNALPSSTIIHRRTMPRNDNAAPPPTLERLLPIGSPTTRQPDGKVIQEDVLSIKSYLHKLKKLLETDSIQGGKDGNNNRQQQQEELLNQLRREIDVLKGQLSHKDAVIAQLKRRPANESCRRSSEISIQTEEGGPRCCCGGAYRFQGPCPGCRCASSVMGSSGDSCCMSSSSSSGDCSTRSDEHRDWRFRQAGTHSSHRRRRQVLRSNEDGTLVITIRSTTPRSSPACSGTRITAEL